MPEEGQKTETKSSEVPSDGQAEKNFKLRFTRVCAESLEGKSEKTESSTSSESSE